MTVIPFNAAGEADGCTEISFTTEELEVVPPAPDCTTIVSPVEGAEDVALDATITWTAVDGADGYRISIGTASGGTDVVDGVEVTGTTFSLADGWQENTTYYVTVIPFNTAGEAEGCTAISFITEELEVVPPAPDCTTIVFPVEGAEDVTLDAVITWTAVDGAEGYRISIGTAPGGMDVVDGEEVTGTAFSLAGGWEENTTYYVTVVPFNTAGEATGCAAISFTTEVVEVVPPAPDCTTIIRPQDGERSGTLDEGIAWVAVDGAEGYRVSIGTTLGGTEVVDNIIVTGTTFYPAFAFADNTPYFLSVIPFNVTGEAAGCPILRFLIIPDTPPEEEPEHHIDRTKYGISPNGDGINDFWEIDGIEHYPDNTVSIYNRWGDLVFQLKNYDNQSRVFDGNANKLTRLGGGMLPSGTYFFAIQYRDNQEMKKVEGMLVIKR